MLHLNCWQEFEQDLKDAVRSGDRYVCAPWHMIAFMPACGAEKWLSATEVLN